MKTSPTFLRPILPSPQLSAKLFATGATLGPIVDSIHNQSLLIYDRAPIYIGPVSSSSLETNDAFLFSSSLYIPPLLGFAYIILGAVLPCILQRTLTMFDVAKDISGSQKDGSTLQSITFPEENNMKRTLLKEKSIISPIMSQRSEETDANSKKLVTETDIRNADLRMILRDKAVLAVTSTALIIKLSDFLQTNPSFSLAIQQTIVQHSGLEIPTNVLNLGFMSVASMIQWLTLDQTLYALFTAILVGIGGPLSELPFVHYGFWHYIPDAANYFPVKEMISWIEFFSSSNNGTFLFLNDYSDLALSSITGPCYFAVTMDAIALGRWLETYDTNKYPYE